MERLLLHFNEKYILYMIFLALGFSKSWIYLPLMGFYGVLKLPTFNLIKIQKSFLILLILYVSFLVLTFTLGCQRLTIESPLRHLASILVVLVFGGLVFHYQKYEIKLNLLGFYLFGLFLDNFIITAYSFFNNPLLYGYGMLISPFSNEEINSPGVSSMLAISFSYFYFFAIYKKENIFIKMLSIIVIVISLGCAIFLGGRMFFIVAFITVIFYFITHVSVKNLVLFFLVCISVGYMISMNEYLASKLDFTINRFINEGLHSLRFQHYLHGLEMFFLHPLGGFEVDTAIEDTKWYHNIFLDTARVAGWIPVLFLLAALLYTAKFFNYRIKHSDISLPFWVATTAFLIMQQDVVLEGGARSLIVLFFSSYILIDSKKDNNVMYKTPVLKWRAEHDKYQSNS